MSETSAGPSEIPWWHAGVIYQVYPRSFADSDGDGIGDLGGVIAKLDHLERLGVDAVWLSPVYASPMVDNGYDISDYQDVAPELGTLAQLDDLLAQAHARGIRIVMDLVVNHTSDQHPWFLDARSSTQSPYRDFYWWRPPREGHVGGEPGAEPTNWGSVFSGPAWEWDEATGEYYLHLFAPEQPELNWEHPPLREAVYSMMRWWLDRGVDGFRMDVVNMISKRVVPGSPGLEDTPLGEAPEDTSGGTDHTAYGDPAPHVFNGPRIHELLAEMHREVFDGRPAGLVTVGEMPVTTVEHARLYTDPARREVDMIFTFEHVDLDSGPGGKWDVVPLPLSALKRSLGAWQTGLADVGWNSLYWSNHDQPRPVSRFGDDSPEHRVRSATALGTVLQLHRGTAYVFQGEELGMTNAPFASIEDFDDVESLGHHREALARGEDPEAVLAALRTKSRDNARTPVQWTAGRHAGFTTGEPWLLVNPNHVEINAESQYDDADSVYSYYRRLIALRHDEPVVARGDFTMLVPEHEQLYAFTREHDGVRLTVVANLSSDGPLDPVAEGVPVPDGAEVVLTNEPDSGASDVLGPWGVRVLRS
ncbi:alpha-glucosidase [Nocardioides aurantiacus]|uniref:Oligo-1,6-glucosidase n=1 Tax=Nocardioides aurantiacus TaxID=86796 RepID=A0A3N2CZT0_9ACTN|nr:alpha-glucosidase [Nocardioides aurantiacus]ROR92993.1 oligo-1,6-glucosidase [Nocardioides aurantiacus]